MRGLNLHLGPAGKACHGHDDVAYDVLERRIVCNKATAGPDTVDNLADLARFADDGGTPAACGGGASVSNDIPCFNQPVLEFPVKNCALILGDCAKKKVRYQRCPRCAGLHKFDPLRFQNGTYCCEDCAKLDLTRHQSGATAMALQCACCGVGGNLGHMQGQTSKPRVRETHVLLVQCPDQWDAPLQYLRFCYRCYKVALVYYKTLPRKELFAKIQVRLADQVKKFSK